MSSIKIKKLTQDEILLLSEIGAKTFDETYSWGNPKADMEEYIAHHFSVEQLTKEYQHKASDFFLVYEKNSPCGYLKLNQNDAQTDTIFDDALEIERLYVLKAHQGKNLGKHLLQLAIKQGKLLGKSMLWLGVWIHNPKAIAFYEKQGFQKCGTHDFWFGGQNQTDYVMKLEL